jgi:prephenate dehydrogenase
VLVIGTGMIGTSVALALRAEDVSVLLADIDPAALAEAVLLGAGQPLGPDDEPGLVVAAVPPDAVASVVTAALAAHPDAVVTDVASVKAGPLSRLLTGPAEVERYVGGHPMAGSERAGPGAARADLFAGRPWAVTPHAHSRPSAVAAVHRLALLCGAVPVTLDAAEHDRAVARVSHLPHTAAAAVAAVLADAPDSHLALTGQGLRDVTRVAAGDPALWTQILRSNAGPVAESLTALRDRLGVLLDALVTTPAPDGPDPLAAALAVGVAGVSRLPGRHGPVESLAEVGVVVADAPGQLARLFAVVEAAGVDVADVRLDHRRAQAVGAVQLSVAPADADRAVTALRAAGWTAHVGDT